NGGRDGFQSEMPCGSISFFIVVVKSPHGDRSAVPLALFHASGTHGFRALIGLSSGTSCRAAGCRRTRARRPPGPRRGTWPIFDSVCLNCSLVFPFVLFSVTLVVLSFGLHWITSTF